GQQLFRRRGAAIHELARHASLRKFQRGLLAAPQRSPPAFLQRLRLLPLGRRPRRRDPAKRTRPRTPRLVGARARRLLQRPPLPSRLCRTARNNNRKRHPQAALRRSAQSLSPGPKRQTLSDVGLHDWLLRLFRESRRPPGPLPLRLSRR